MTATGANSGAASSGSSTASGAGGRSVTNPDGSKVEYTYDALGNCLSVTTHINAADITGKKVIYTYDALGRKISVTDWLGQQTIYRYDARGRLLEVQRPNGVLSAYSYNLAGRLATLVHSKSGSNLAIYEYRYDAAGNRTYAKEKINSPHILFLPIILKEEGGEAGTLATEGTLEEEQPIPLDEPGDPNLDAYPAPLPIEGEEGLEVQSPEPASLMDTGYPAPGATPSASPPAMVIPTPGEVEITYTYDALNRMTSASYTDGTAFSYTYDAAGNTLQLVKTISGQSSTVAYSYDTDNQIATSRENSGTVWQYQFDGNGSLIETRPGNQAGNGARRYSYNSAGQLIKVEAHNGTSYQTQAAMVYNGLGQRLGLNAYQAGQSLNTSYILDGDALLAATANGQSTYYVPGLAEYKSAWNYYLSDGQQTARQITDGQGMVLLSRRFTPWGELLDQTGNGKLTWDYLGGVLDAATGLIYVGNGQYYDPASGRFLSRGMNPGAPKPYVPWQGNPLGMMLGPLAVLVLMRGKRKGGKIDRFLVVLIMAFAVSMTVTGGENGGGGEEAPTSTVTDTAEPGPTQPGGGMPTATEAPTENPTQTPVCPPADAGTPTPPPTPSEAAIQLTIYDLKNYVLGEANRIKSVTGDEGKVVSILRRLMDKAADMSLSSNQLAYIYATTHVESSWGDFTEKSPINQDPDTYFENLYGYKSPLADQLGNIDPGDGPRYKGRGYVHLTGRGNYRKISEALSLGTELEDFPDRAAYGPNVTCASCPYDYAVEIAVTGMAQGIFTGQSLFSYENADGSFRFEEARSIIGWPGDGSGSLAGGLGVGFATILNNHCAVGGVTDGIVCRDTP